MAANTPNIKNRRATYDYEVLEKFEAGVALNGGEVKSIRSGGCSLAGSYVIFRENEAYIHGMHVKHYENDDGVMNELRDRKLLLRKAQIRKLSDAVCQRGMTVVPLSLYFTRGIVKIQIALSRGKHNHDKRASIKERDLDRETKRGDKGE